MSKFKYYIFLLLLSIISVNKSYSSDIQINIRSSIGYPMANFTAGEVYKGENLNATMFFKPQIMLNLTSYNIASFIYFSSHILSPYGLLPLVSSGIGAFYYPSGFPILKTSPQLNTKLKYSKFSPYFGLATGLTRMSISDIEQNISFLSNTMDITAAIGVDYPVSNHLVTGIELSYSSSFIGGKKNLEGSISNNTSINICLIFAYYP